MFLKNEFWRNIATVLTGTTFAQAIPLLVLPILTRLYGPEEFGVFYLYSAFSTLLLIAATGKYEYAIMVPENEEEALQMGTLSFIVTCLTSLLVTVLLVLFQNPIVELLGEPRIFPWIYMVPATMFIKGGYGVFRFWFNRFKKFKTITWANISVSLGNAGGRIALYPLFPGPGGLILGTLLAQGIGFFYLFWKGGSVLFKQFFSKPLGFWLDFGKKYINFPRDMIPGAMLHSGSLQAPPILLTSLFSVHIAGLYGMMNRVLRLPIETLGIAVEEVFRQKASQDLRELGTCRGIYFSTLSRLAVLSFGPFLLFYFMAPWLFEFALGEQWRIAGIYAQWFTLPCYLTFLTTPLYSLFYINGRTYLFTLVYFIQFTLVIIAFFIPLWEGASPLEGSLWSLAIAFTLGQLISLLILTRIAMIKSP